MIYDLIAHYDKTNPVIVLQGVTGSAVLQYLREDDGGIKEPSHWEIREANYGGSNER